jgi:L-ascorbate metabolism protein UlaG (beta-lactamase superfamily)
VRAAEAVRRIGPRVAVPVHWGTLALAGLAGAPGRAGARMRRLLVEPPREFAAAVAAGGSRAEVLVTEPGERVRLPDTMGSDTTAIDTARPAPDPSNGPPC